MTEGRNFGAVIRILADRSMHTTWGPRLLQYFNTSRAGVSTALGTGQKRNLFSREPNLYECTFDHEKIGKLAACLTLH